jgi:hypothetical protein
MNTGLDAMCEAFNAIDISGNAGIARYLTQFDNQEIIDIINTKISGSQYNVYFKNFIATAQGINANTSIEVLPLAQQWNNGTGHYLDSPQIEDGASWYYSNYSGSGLWNLSGSYNIYGYTVTDQTL